MKQQGLLSVIRSPWVLTTIPLLLGGMWLILHPGLIIDNLNQPYMLAIVPTAIASAIVGWLFIKFFKAIEKGSKSVWGGLVRAQKEDSSAQFFWITIVVFMIVSVFASGNFFTNLEHNVVPCLGFATAFFIDMVAVQCMRARMNAVRMRDQRGQLLYLFGVFVCAGASAWANVYSSLAEFDQKVTGVLPPWMLNAAPWFGLVFPALIILLSITADYTLDQTSTKLDPENYRTQEAKRIQLIEIQRDMLRSRMQIEQEIDQITLRLKSGKSGRTFFLFAWLFPKDPLNIQAVITSVTEEIRKVYDQQFASLSGQVTLQLRGIEEQTSVTLSGIQTAHEIFSSNQTAVNEQVFELAKHIESSQQFHEKMETNLDEMRHAFEHFVSEQEVTLSEQIAAQIEEYIPTETPGDMSTIHEGVKPLNIKITDEVNEVIKKYPIVEQWIRTGVRSVSRLEIIAGTHFSAQLVGRRIEESVFARTRRDGFFTTRSVINWLKVEPPPRAKSPRKQPQTTEEFEAITQTNITDSTAESSENGHSKVTVHLDQNELLSDIFVSPVLQSANTSSDETLIQLPADSEDISVVSEDVSSEIHQEQEGEQVAIEEIGSDQSDKEVEQSASDTGITKRGVDKLAITLAVMRDRPGITDEELMQPLGLKRPASARFWRLKAQEILSKEQQPVASHQNGHVDLEEEVKLEEFAPVV